MKVVKKKTIRKKLIKAIICTVITAGSMCNAFATVPICAASAIGEFANVVVLVRFKGDMQGDNGTGFNKPYNSTIANAPRTYWESLIRKFNGVNDKFGAGSFKEYLRDISGGQHMVESVFPQTDGDGLICYLTMERTVDEYKSAVGEIQMIKEIAGQLNAKYPNLDGRTIDRDNDGIADNLMIIAQVQSNGHFVAHSANAGNDTKIAGKGIGPYNLIETTFSDTSGYYGFNIHTAAHEYIHTFGVPDYYRQNYISETRDTPVGLWDPMGVPGGRPMPLAVTREAIGWTTVDEIQPQNGVYTLYEASAAYADKTKKQAVKVKPPFSPTEYFVIEYRKKGERYKFDTLDQTAPADGIIVYRVNPVYKDEGNLRGNDYIYVYRPNDTSITASAGEIGKAQIGLPVYSAARQEIGSLDLNQTITDNAVCYSDGRNSGIHIKVTEQNVNSVKFSIEFPDYTNMDLWKSLANADGGNALSGIKASEVKTAADGNNLYVLAQDIRSSSVLRYDGDNWTNLGKCAETGGSGALTVFNSEPYVLFADYNGKCELKKYSGGKWNTVSVLNFGANKYSNAPALGAAGGKLYALIDDCGKNPQLYALNSGTLEKSGSALNVKLVASPEIFDKSGCPAVIYGDFFGKKTEAKILELDGWKSIVTESGSANANDAAAADGEVYLFSTYNEQSPKLNILTNDGMNLAYDLSAVPANSSYGSIAVGTECIYISVLQDDAVVTYSTPKDEPQNLTRLGDVTCRPAWNGSMQLINNMVYSAVVSSTDMPIDVKYHEALDDTLRLAKAKAIAESIVEGYRATNSSGKAELEYKIKAGLSESGYTNVTAEVNEFTVTPATASAEGSATGTITLVCGRKSDIVRINKTIAKLTETKILFLSDKEVRVSLNDTGEKYVIFAEYEGEKLKRTAIVPVTFNEPGEKTILLPSGWTKTTANALRAFFWNSLEDIRPLCGNAAR